MSSRSEAITPHPEWEALSPSPARNALQSNLESGLTLTRKKSWFGSAREWASKGAHHAKGYFDKHDGIKAEFGRGRQLAANETHDGGPLSPELDCSDDDTSTTPFKPTPLRHRTFTPKTAIASLHQHTQSATGRHKRGALSSIHGPEAIDAHAEHHTPTAAGDAPKGHARKSSTAKSLVGSLRGLGRKTTASRAISPEKVLEQRESSLSSEEEAAFVPLPSSPINITPLPTLSLDLPPSALVPDSFGRTPPDGSELMRQIDPRIDDPRPVPTYYTRVPGEGPVDQMNLESGHADKASVPRAFIGLQSDDLGLLPNPGPPTPMPGTTCGLELDGNSLPAIRSVPPVQAPAEPILRPHMGLDGANDETELFERNVEYKDEIKKKENRTLKKMVSLDAMAEQCAALTPNQRLGPTLRNVSDVTIKECPDDMPKLTRKWAHLQTPSAGHRCPQTGDWKSEDPFAPGNAIGDLAVDQPPTSGAQVIMPLRPKITLQSADSAEPRTLNDNDLPMLVDGVEDLVTIPDKPTASTDKVQVCGWSEIEMPPHNNPSFVPEMTSVGKHNGTPVVTPDTPSNSESEAAARSQTPVRRTAIDDGPPPTASACHDPPVLDAFAEPQVQELVAYEPSIDGSDQDSMHGSLHRKSSVMQIYELLTKNQTPSPKRMATGVIASNTAAALWRFRPWNTSPPATKQLQEETAGESDRAARDISPRRRRSSDLEVEPSESGRSPFARSTISAMESPSMGDRVDFDVEHAERAERCVALADTRNLDNENPVVFDDMDSILAPSPLRPEHKNEAELKEAELSNDDQSPPTARPRHDSAQIPSPFQPAHKNEPEFEESDSSAKEQSLPKARSRRDSGHASCYSIDSDLQTDLAGIYELQNAMSGTTFDPHPVAGEDSDPMTPVPSSAQFLLPSHAADGGAEPQNTDDHLASSPSEDTPALSPGETKFWREVQSCPFDTPQQTPVESPTHSLHQRQSTVILSAMPYANEVADGIDDAAGESTPPYARDENAFQQRAAQDDIADVDPEQTLDEGLELYHSYTSNPDMRYSDTPPVSKQGSPEKNPFTSPDSGYNPDQSSDAEKELSSPTTYRSRKTTIASPPR